MTCSICGKELESAIEKEWGFCMSCANGQGG